MLEVFVSYATHTNHRYIESSHAKWQKKTPSKIVAIIHIWFNFLFIYTSWEKNCNKKLPYHLWNISVRIFYSHTSFNVLTPQTCKYFTNFMISVLPHNELCCMKLSGNIAYIDENIKLKEHVVSLCFTVLAFNLEFFQENFLTESML